MFIIKPCIICQCNKYLKIAHTYKVAASLYIVAAMMMTSSLNLGQIKTIEWNVLTNKLVEVIYNSKSNNQGEKCHNVVCINKRSKQVTSPI